MRAPAIAPIMLIGLALLGGACGGSSDAGGGGSTGASPAGASTTGATPAGETSTSSGSELDVCSLVSAADVEAVLGEAADAGIDNSSGDLRVCYWTATARPTAVLTISIYVHPDSTTARGQYLATTEGLGGVDILNLADEASYSEGFGLRVLSGRYDVGIDGAGDDEKASSLKLAQEILPQLP